MSYFFPNISIFDSPQNPNKDLTQKLQLVQLQFLPGGPLEKISERFFLYSGVKPEFQFPVQVNTTSVN